MDVFIDRPYGSGINSSQPWTVLQACYNSRMQKTLTVRLTTDQDRALTRRAKALGKTRSEIVRELIEKGLDEEPLGRKIAHLKGILTALDPTDPVRRRIKQRNWR